MVTHDRIRLTACYREAPLSRWRRGFSTYGRPRRGGANRQRPPGRFATRSSFRGRASAGRRPYARGAAARACASRRRWRAGQTTQSPSHSSTVRLRVLRPSFFAHPLHGLDYRGHTVLTTRHVVLPDPDDFPPAILKLARLAHVPFHVVPDLLCPPLGVGLWQPEMTRAAVPEAPIDEDTHSWPTKHDVGSAPDALLRRAILPEPETSTVKKRTQSTFRPALPADVRDHDLPYCW